MGTSIASLDWYKQIQYQGDIPSDPGIPDTEPTKVCVCPDV